MPSFDDLKRINKANSIINRSNLNMGLRPMYLELAEDEPETLESASFASKVDDSLRTAKDNQVITAEEYYSNRSSFLDDSYYEEDLDEDLYQDAWENPPNEVFTSSTSCGNIVNLFKLLNKYSLYLLIVPPLIISVTSLLTFGINRLSKF